MHRTLARHVEQIPRRDRGSRVEARRDEDDAPPAGSGHVQRALLHEEQGPANIEGKGPVKVRRRGGAEIAHEEDAGCAPLSLARGLWVGLERTYRWA